MAGWNSAICRPRPPASDRARLSRGRVRTRRDLHRHARLRRRPGPRARRRDAAIRSSIPGAIAASAAGPIYSRFGYGGFGRYRSPFFWGWHDPFWGGYDVDSYTLYTSYLELDIRRASDGQSLFEGKAQARSRTNELPRLVPNLVEAMFTGFPGNNGETVRITVMPEREGQGRN